MSKKKEEKQQKQKQKEFQVCLKIVSYYEKTIKADDFHDAIEKAKNFNSYEILTNEIPFDSGNAELWCVTDLSA